VDARARAQGLEVDLRAALDVADRALALDLHAVALEALDVHEAHLAAEAARDGADAGLDLDLVALAGRALEALAALDALLEQGRIEQTLEDLLGRPGELGRARELHRFLPRACSRAASTARCASTAARCFL
jgi:hypothetical protein